MSRNILRIRIILIDKLEIIWYDTFVRKCCLPRPMGEVAPLGDGEGEKIK